MPLVLPGEFLGEVEMAAGGATSNVLVFPRYKWLTFLVCVTGYASGGIISLQFGTAGTIDTGTNYRHRNLLPPATTGTAWGTGVASSTTTADTMMRLAADSVTVGRLITVDCMNRNTINGHTFSWRTVNEASSDISHPTQSMGDGSYHPASAAYINCARITTSGGNLNAGSGFAVYGQGRIRG